MADNVTLNSGSGGAALKTDELADLSHVQYVKLMDGTADGTGVIPGDATNGLLVNLGSNNDVTVSGTVPVTDNGGSLTVDGTVGISGSVAVTDNAGSLTVDNSTLSVVGGGVEATALRVTLANDSTGVVSVDDNGASLTVDGTVAATQSGTWNVGTVTSVTNTVTVSGTVTANLAAGTNTNEVVGDAAHDAAVAGNPLRIAGRAVSADYTSVATGDTADLITTLGGKLVVHPYAIPENLVKGSTSDITTTTSTSVVAAAGVGLKNYITHIVVQNSHATVGTWVLLQDGSGGTTIYQCYAAAVGGGASITLPAPIATSANTALFCACVTTGANVRVSASGYKAP